MQIFYSSVDIPALLSSSDWIIFALVAVFTIAVVYCGHRYAPTKSSPLEYLLMGRQLTFPLFVATLVATWYGGIFGVTQIAFEQGIYCFLTQGLFWYITYLCFAFYMVKRIRHYKVLTLPELVKKLYGPKSAKLCAIFIFIKTLPITYAISIGAFLQCLLPISLFDGITVAMLFVITYSLFGGFRSIVFSDLAQFIIMCLGIVSVLYFSVTKLGGYSFLQFNLPVNHLHWQGTHSISTTIIWFFIACSTTFINPAFYQRCFAAKNDNTAKFGIIVSTLIWILFDICTTFSAMYARAVIPESDSLHAYLIYSMQILPNGWKGLFLASIAATILSTLDSFLFIASNILFYDLPIINLKNKTLQHAFTLTITSAITIACSMCFNGNIESIWFHIKSYFSACLLFPILWGYICAKYLQDKHFMLCCLASLFSMALWDISYYKAYYDIDAFYIGCSITCIVMLFCTIYSRRRLRPAHDHS